MKEKKFTGTKVDDSKIIGKSEKKFTQTKSGDLVKITFRQNRKFDLHLGKKVYTFYGRETKEVPKIYIEHKDFTDNIKHYFVIHK